jgi:small subunit ribosomal protein S21
MAIDWSLDKEKRESHLGSPVPPGRASLQAANVLSAPLPRIGRQRLCFGMSFTTLFGTGGPSRVQVVVRDNNVDQALKALKKKLQREGVFREMKLRRHYEKPSERRDSEAAEAVRRARKVERKRLEREGF